jgi:murein DD-endopeptidase MepM/ murein hydrolase activator NlpD
VLWPGCGSADEVTTRSGDLAALVQPPEPAPAKPRRLLLKPVDRGRLTSAYGARYNPFSKVRQMHQGIDWAAPRGTPVLAAGDGVVVAAGRLGSYGRYVRIDHGDTVETAYAHLDRYASKLRPGRIVSQGDEVGRVGSTGRATGPHLHYEVLVAGRQVDPLAFAPAATQPSEDLADAAAGGVGDEFGIGGPDIAVEAADDDADPPRDDAAAPAEAIDASAVIWIDDLLKNQRP